MPLKTVLRSEIRHAIKSSLPAAQGPSPICLKGVQVQCQKVAFSISHFFKRSKIVSTHPSSATIYKIKPYSTSALPLLSHLAKKSLPTSETMLDIEIFIKSNFFLVSYKISSLHIERTMLCIFPIPSLTSLIYFPRAELLYFCAFFITPSQYRLHCEPFSTTFVSPPQVRAFSVSVALLLEESFYSVAFHIISTEINSP